MKFQGELVELEFYLNAYRMGITISKPFGDNARYDFITDRNSLQRVQVKSTVFKDISSRGDMYKVATSFGSSNKLKYSKLDIDVFACYVIPELVWYIIPVEHVTATKINLAPHKPLSKGKYERFREAWHLL